MKLDTLDGLNDTELQAVIARCQELLKSRDDARKAKAMSDARALLASVGLSLKDLGGKPGKAVGFKPYKGGRLYRHPADASKVWNAKGQKPGWLRELETEGRRPIEIPQEAANGSVPAPTKRAV